MIDEIRNSVMATYHLISWRRRARWNYGLITKSPLGRLDAKVFACSYLSVRDMTSKITYSRRDWEKNGRATRREDFKDEGLRYSPVV